MYPIIGIKYHPHAKITTICIPSSAVAGKGQLIAGQFFWVNIPAISPLEWHPFTMVSSPFLAQLSVEKKYTKQQRQPRQPQQDHHHLGFEDGEASGHIAFAIKMIGKDDDDNNNNSINNDPSWTSQLASLARKREQQAQAQTAVRAAKGGEINVGECVRANN